MAKKKYYTKKRGHTPKTPKPPTVTQLVDKLKRTPDKDLPKFSTPPVAPHEKAESEKGAPSAFRIVESKEEPGTFKMDGPKAQVVESGETGYEGKSPEEVATDQAVRVRNIERLLTDILSAVRGE